MDRMSWNSGYNYSGVGQPPMPPALPPPPPPPPPSYPQGYYNSEYSNVGTGSVLQQETYPQEYTNQETYPGGYPQEIYQGEYSQETYRGEYAHHETYSGQYTQKTDYASHQYPVSSSFSQSQQMSDRRGVQQKVATTTGKNQRNGSQSAGSKNSNYSAAASYNSGVHQSHGSRSSQASGTYSVSSVGKALVKSLGTLLATQQSNLEQNIYQAKSKNAQIMKKMNPVSFVKSHVLQSQLSSDRIQPDLRNSNKMTVQLTKSGLGFSAAPGQFVQGAAGGGRGTLHKKKQLKNNTTPQQNLAPPAPKVKKPLKEKEFYKAHHHGLGFIQDAGAPTPAPNTKWIPLYKNQTTVSKGRGKNCRIIHESVLHDNTRNLMTFKAQGELSTITADQLAAQQEQFEDSVNECMDTTEPVNQTVEDVMLQSQQAGSYPHQHPPGAYPGRKRPRGELPFGMEQLLEPQNMPYGHGKGPVRVPQLPSQPSEHEQVDKLGICVKKFVKQEGKQMNPGEIFKKALSSFVLRCHPVTLITKEENDVANFLRYGKMVPYSCSLFFGKLFIAKGGADSVERAKQQAREVACNRLNSLSSEQLIEEAAVEENAFPDTPHANQCDRQVIKPPVQQQPSLPPGGHPGLLDMRPADHMGGRQQGPADHMGGLQQGPVMNQQSMPYERGQQRVGQMGSTYGGHLSKPMLQGSMSKEFLDKFCSLVKKTRKQEGPQSHGAHVFNMAVERFTTRCHPITIITKDDNDVANFLRYGRMLPFSSMLFYGDLFIAKGGGESLRESKRQVQEVACNRLLSIAPVDIIEEAQIEDNMFPSECVHGEVDRMVIDAPCSLPQEPQATLSQMPGRPISTNQPMMSYPGHQGQAPPVGRQPYHSAPPYQSGTGNSAHNQQRQGTSWSGQAPQKWLVPAPMLDSNRNSKRRKIGYQDSRFKNDATYQPPKLIPSLFHVTPAAPTDVEVEEEEYKAPQKKKRDKKMVEDEEPLAARLERLRKLIKTAEGENAQEIITNLVKTTEDVNTSVVIVSLQENDVEMFMKEGVMNPITSRFYIETRKIMQASGQTVEEAVKKLFEKTLEYFKSFRAATILDKTNVDDSLPANVLETEVDRFTISSPVGLTPEKVTELIRSLKETPPEAAIHCTQILKQLCLKDEISIPMTLITCADGPTHRRIHTAHLYLGDFFLAEATDSKKMVAKSMVHQMAVKKLMKSSLEDIMSEERRLPRVPLPCEIHRDFVSGVRSRGKAPDSYSNIDIIKRDKGKQFKPRPWSDLVIQHNRYPKVSEIAAVFLQNSCAQNDILFEVKYEETNEPVTFRKEVCQSSDQEAKTNSKGGECQNGVQQASTNSKGTQKGDGGNKDRKNTKNEDIKAVHVKCQVFIEQKLAAEIVTNDDITSQIVRGRNHQEMQTKVRAVSKQVACDLAMCKLYKECWTMENKIQSPLDLKVVTKDEILAASRGKKLASQTEMSSGVGSDLLNKMGWTGGGLGSSSNTGQADPVKSALYSDFTNRGLGFSHETMPMMSGEQGEDYRELVEVYLDNYIQSGSMDDMIFPPLEFNLEERLAIVQVARKLGLTTQPMMHKNTKYLAVCHQAVGQKLLDMLKAVGGSNNKYDTFPPGTFSECRQAPLANNPTDVEGPMTPFGEQNLFTKSDGNYQPMDAEDALAPPPGKLIKTQTPKWQQWKKDSARLATPRS